MIYCDPSLLVSIITIETHSGVARTWYFAEGRAPCAISDWSRTEIASALTKKRRNGFIDDDSRSAAQVAWTALDSEMTCIPVLPVHFLHASELVDAMPRGLRSGDALHLAIALEQGFELATFDRDLAEAARALGVLVHPA